jgi:hypothetical protein
MNPLRLCGHLLLWIGFLCGALVAVRNTENAASPWSTISWPAYCAALGVAVIGVVLLRSTKRTARLGSRTHADDVEQMDAALRRLSEQLQAWRTDEAKPSVHDMHRQIDQRLSDDLALFANLRESLIDAFGLQNYAAIMTEFALAERTINRMWSASADGYVDEVELCLERAVEHVGAAIQRLETAQFSNAAFVAPPPA